MSVRVEEVLRCDSCGRCVDGESVDFIFRATGHGLCTKHDLCRNCLNRTDYKYCQICDPDRYKRERSRKC